MQRIDVVRVDSAGTPFSVAIASTLRPARMWSSASCNPALVEILLEKLLERRVRLEAAA